MTEKERKRILVVDEEVNVCKSIRHVLLRESYEVDMALSEQEALSIESQRSYDVIIVDLMMPGMGGLDLLRLLMSSYPSAKIIVIAGYPMSKTAVQSEQIGAFDYLSKPFLPSELRSLIARAVGARE